MDNLYKLNYAIAMWMIAVGFELSESTTYNFCFSEILKVFDVDTKFLQDNANTICNICLAESDVVQECEYDAEDILFDFTFSLSCPNYESNSLEQKEVMEIAFFTNYADKDVLIEYRVRRKILENILENNHACFRGTNTFWFNTYATQLEQQTAFALLSMPEKMREEHLYYRVLEIPTELSIYDWKMVCSVGYPKDVESNVIFLYMEEGPYSFDTNEIKVSSDIGLMDKKHVIAWDYVRKPSIG